MAREAATQAVKDQVTAVYEEKYADHEEFDRIMRDVAEILEQMEHAEVRRLITEDKVRPDGRKVDEIRPLDAVVDFLPRVHGSGLFTRGQTQALSVLTLAPMGETQIIDGLDPEYKKRFMHHYNFPQYSVGKLDVTVRLVVVKSVTVLLVSVPLLKSCQAWRTSHMPSAW